MLERARVAHAKAMTSVSNDLVCRARGGERQALVQLVEASQAHVYSIALALLREPADASDATQETFIRLLRALPSYRGDGASFPSWLRRMTVNISLDALRRRARSATTGDDAVAEVIADDPWQEPAFYAERAESAREMRAALDELSASQRAALTLHYLEDSPYEEVAEAMGVPLNTVKSHILRGKERMARLLGGPRLATSRIERWSPTYDQAHTRRVRPQQSSNGVRLAAAA
jgi:RNA polymerase sigma-70 factor, ECF subfamily